MASMGGAAPLTCVPSLLFALALAACAAARSNGSGTSLSIYRDSDTYSYHGCYSETAASTSSGVRALSDGSTDIRPDEMTVPECLDFCLDGGGETYEFAGLQFSRECWCAQEISPLSDELDDDECDLACAGDEDVACGGADRLSVYRLRAADGDAAGSNGCAGCSAFSPGSSWPWMVLVGGITGYIYA